MSEIKKYYKIAVPTKRYLKKYISNKFGFGIMVNKKNLIGVMVYNMALKKIDSKVSGEQQDERIKNYDAELTLLAPVSVMRTVGVSLSKHSVIQMNRFFETMLASDLYDYCQKNTNQDTRRKGYDKAIISFAEMYFFDLDTDISFDALKQTEFRYRKKISNICPRSDISF